MIKACFIIAHKALKLPHWAESHRKQAHKFVSYETPIVLLSLLFAGCAIANATSTNTPPASTPVFSVRAGTYTSTQSVTISDSTSGATIYYTTDGSTPSASSLIYTGPVSVSSTETLSAAAIATGSSISAIATSKYTITPPAAAPVFSVASGTYVNAQSISISDATPGATIYYTNNGSQPTTASAVYSGPITFTSNTAKTFTAAAIASGYSMSPSTSATYTITPPAAAPTFSIAGGTYTTSKTVVVYESTPGSTVYYTLDGTVPTTSSAKCTGTITISSTSTLSAVAIAPGYSTSAVAAATYTITPPASTPVIFSPCRHLYFNAECDDQRQHARGNHLLHDRRLNTFSLVVDLYGSDLSQLNRNAQCRGNCIRIFHQRHRDLEIHDHAAGSRAGVFSRVRDLRQCTEHLHQ